MPRIWSKGAPSTSSGEGETYKAGEGLDESGSKPVTFFIKALGIVAGMISAEAITTAKIKLLAITEGLLAAEAVTNAKVKLKSLEGNRLAKETLGEEEIQTNAIGERVIASGAVVAAKIGSEAVETAKIKGLAVTAAKLAAEAVETAKIKGEAVTLEKLSAAVQTKLGEIKTYTAKAAGGLELSGTEFLIKAAGVTDAMLKETYALLAGRAGGQTLSGSAAKEGAILRLQSYPSNEVSRLVLADTVATFTGPVECFGTFAASELTTLFFLKTKTFKLTPKTEAGIAASKNNYGGAVNATSRIKATKAVNITGLNVETLGVEDGEIKSFINFGTFAITFINESAESEEVNRFLFSAGANVELKANEVLAVQYDATTKRWRGLYKSNI